MRYTTITLCLAACAIASPVKRLVSLDHTPAVVDLGADIGLAVGNGDLDLEANVDGDLVSRGLLSLGGQRGYGPGTSLGVDAGVGADAGAGNGIDVDADLDIGLSRDKRHLGQLINTEALDTDLGLDIDVGLSDVLDLEADVDGDLVSRGLASLGGLGGYGQGAGAGAGAGVGAGVGSGAGSGIDLGNLLDLEATVDIGLKPRGMLDIGSEGSVGLDTDELSVNVEEEVNIGSGRKFRA